VPDSLLDPRAQHAVIRNDRQCGNRGGVCAFVSKKLRCLPLSLPSVVTGMDLACFDVFCNSSKYRFIWFYRPPGTDAVSRHTAGLLCNALEEFATVDIPTFIDTGLNCPNIDWQSHSRVIGEIDCAFGDFTTGNGYVQCVMEATRGNNILDLVFCNDPILMSHIDVLPPFSSSDHNAIEFVISCESTDYSIDSGETRKRYLWSEDDYESMAAYLHQVRWPDLLTTNFTANDL